MYSFVTILQILVKLIEKIQLITIAYSQMYRFQKLITVMNKHSSQMMIFKKKTTVILLAVLNVHQLRKYF